MSIQCMLEWAVAENATEVENTSSNDMLSKYYMFYNNVLDQFYQKCPGIP